MSEIFVYPIMGGGGSGASSTLSVIGVAGSTVTVSNGDKSYTRTLDSDGKATFKGLASGTWTVTMTDGTDTASDTVSITTDGQTAAVKLVYFNEIIYDAGTVYAEMEMINSSENKYSVTYNTSSLTFACSGHKGAGFLAAKVDVTDFSTLKVSYTSRAYGSAAINETATADYGTYPAARTQFLYRGDTIDTVSLDISSFSGKYYVGIWEHQWNDSSGSAEIYKIWLE